MIAFPIPLVAAAQAAADAYTKPPTWIGPGQYGSVHAVHSIVNDIDVVAFRGTDDVRVLLLDFKIGKVDVADHPEVGRIHKGAHDAIAAIMPLIAADLGDRPYVVPGHSWGGGLAQVLPIYMRRAIGILGLAPMRVFADFVPPAISNIAIAFRFGNDPVPDEPGWIAGLACQPIGMSAPWPLDCHHAARYVDAIGRLTV